MFKKISISYAFTEAHIKIDHNSIPNGDIVMWRQVSFQMNNKL